MSKLCPALFWNMPDLDTQLVRHATEVKYVRRMRNMLRTDQSPDRDGVDLSCRCLPSLFSSFYPIREGRKWSRDMDLEVQQKSKGLLFDWHDIELFTVSAAWQGLV